MKKEKTALSTLSKMLKGAGIAVGGMAIFLYASPYIFKGTIDQGIQEVAKNYVKTDVQFKKLDISFFKHFPKLTVTLEDSSIKGTDPFGETNLIDAKEIALGVDIKSLFGDKIIFNELYIDQANIHLMVNHVGQNNYDIMRPTDEVESEENSSVGLALNDIKVSNSTFDYTDQATQIQLNLKGFEYEGLVELKDNNVHLDAETKVKDAFFKFEQETYVKHLPLSGKVNTTMDLNALSFDFLENNFELGNFPFSLQGSLQMPDENKVFDLKITSNPSDLKYLPAIIPEAYQAWAKDIELKGAANIVMTLKGIMNPDTKQNPDLHLETKVIDASINYQKSSSPIQRLNLTAVMDLPALDPEKLRVKVDQLEFKLLEGTTKTNFTFWAGKTMYSEGQIVSNLDLEALKNATGFKKISTKGVLNIEGDWKGSIVTTAHNDLLKIPTFNVKANLANGYFKLDEMPAALDHINVDMEMHNQDGQYKHTSIAVHQIDAKALENYVVGKINVKNLENFPIDADVKAKIHLQDIYKIYPLDGIELRGDLFAHTKANGKYDPKRQQVPVTNTVLVVKNGYLRYADMPNLPLENINVETHIKSGKGSFKDLSVKILPISFTLAGKPFMVNADFKDLNNLDYRIHSKGQLKLGDFYQLFPIDGLDVDGIITANVGLKGQNGAALENFQNRGFVKLENITVRTKFFPSKFKIKEGLFKFNGNQLTFEQVKARYKRNAMVFDGKVTNYINYALKEKETLKGEVNFTSNKININDFMAFNTGETSNNSAAAGVVLLPTNVELTLKGKAKKVLYNDLTIENFDGTLSLQKGKLGLEQTQFNLVGSTFNLNGTYQPINARNATFSFEVKGNNFDIQRAYKEITLFREMVSAAEKAHGNVSLDYHLEGNLGADMFPRLKTVKGQGDLVVEDVQFMGFKVFNTVAEKTSKEVLHDAKLKNVKIHTSIDKNVITIDRTKFKIAGFRPRIEGQVTLDGYMNIGMRLGLPPFGLIGIPIKITGPADTFEVEVGKYHKEDLDETDDDFAEYQQSIVEEKAKAIQQ